MPLPPKAPRPYSASQLVIVPQRPGDEVLYGCRRCGIPQPGSAFYKDHRRTNKLADICKTCFKATIVANGQRKREEAAAARRAERALLPEGHKAPTPIRPTPAPAPSDTLRAQFQQATAKQWPRICKQAADLAARGDRQMLRLVLAYGL